MTAALGPAALGASKSIYCSGKSCVIAGLNSSTIANGTIAVVSVQLSASATGNLAIQLSNALATTPQGEALPITTVGGEVSVNSQTVTLNVNPSSVTVGKSQMQQFWAAVTGSPDMAVSWSLTPNLGQLTASGLYTAPSTISSRSTITVTATSKADPTKSASATVTLRPDAITSVAVNPTSITLTNSRTTAIITASVAGTADTAINWTVSPQVGTVVKGAQYLVYIAPPATTGATVTITATSVADPTKSASAVVTVERPR